MGNVITRNKWENQQ